MMELSLPSPESTNGTWLANQAMHNLQLSMVLRDETWGPRYGLLPGYGITMQNGFEDVFTATAMAALEWGAMPYAKGLIDAQYRHYIRNDGLTNYRAEELGQQARMLTILALYHSYAGGDDDFVLSHFAKAKALATWLIARRDTSLHFPSDDPRHGMIPGLDEGDHFVRVYYHGHQQSHWYSAAAESYRAFTELGRVWATVGKATGRSDVSAHGAELLKLAPILYHDLHASLNRTVNTTASPGHRCYPSSAEGPGYFAGCPFRTYPEMFYSGALNAEQTDAIFTAGLGVASCPTGRFLGVGSPAGGGSRLFVHTPQGWPFGLLVHDMVERFLLHCFTQSAHTNTRGTFSTPESTTLDRDGYDYAIASAGFANVPLCLKWMLVFEEPETRTLWLAKATPRDWLALGELPLVASRLSTRYGRVAFSLKVSQGAHTDAPYTVIANISLPKTFAAGSGPERAPPGGIRLRIRAPPSFAGRLSGATVGGKRWDHFNASEETIDFPTTMLTTALIENGLHHVVATFAGAATTLREARSPRTRLILPMATQVEMKSDEAPAVSAPLSSALTLTPPCPDGTTRVDAFELNGTSWAACEDLQTPGGALALLSSNGDAEWFTKGYAPYESNWTDHKYYLGCPPKALDAAQTDLLGAKLLTQKALTWAMVERAVPPIRTSGTGGACHTNRPVRTFVGSRGASVDTTFGPFGGDANWEGWPSRESYAINMHNKAVGEPTQAHNSSGGAEGLLGGVIPTVVLYLPMVDNGTSRNRYWTYTAVPVADTHGSREQAVLFRFQQLECSGPNMRPPCKMLYWPMYWDSYWFARFPGANASDTAEQTLRTGPVNATSANEFYSTLLETRRWWAAELAAEGMMELSLPSPANTNGTWLANQAVNAIVRSMITRQNTWEPRYGVCPGYGAAAYNGHHDAFTGTAMAALEAGAMPYARGTIDYHFLHYVRTDGLVWYRAIAVPACARMLTILALYHSYAGGDDDFVLSHFAKAKALATWLIARRDTSLHFPSDDPRHGMIPGLDEGDHFVRVYYHGHQQSHWYSAAAESYRAFTELGRVWATVGKATGRSDVSAHGAELLKLAPILYHDLHASLNRTVNTTASPGHRCWQSEASAAAVPQGFRPYSEMFFSGALSSTQLADIYASASGAARCGTPRHLTVGSPGIGGATMSTSAVAGFGYGLLQADMIDEFLLHYFAISAHAYTRGTFTTSESASLADRDKPPAPYTVDGVVLAPLYLKWLLCFEDLETRTLWLGKAVPRDWLAPSEAPLSVERLSTRYGRIALRLEASEATSFVVKANVTLSATFVPPAGGVRLRVRTPLVYEGKLSSVTVGGKAWHAFDAAGETVLFSASRLKDEVLRKALQSIMVRFEDAVGD